MPLFARIPVQENHRFCADFAGKAGGKSFSPQALVLCPTRELAHQVADEIRKLAKSMLNIKILTLCGGEPSRIQTNSLEHGAHVLVGTPGRVLDHLEQGNVDLSMLTTLVLDEADRMLEMGFQDSLNAIVKHIPKHDRHYYSVPPTLKISPR